MNEIKLLYMLYMAYVLCMCVCVYVCVCVFEHGLWQSLCLPWLPAPEMESTRLASHRLQQQQQRSQSPSPVRVCSREQQSSMVHFPFVYAYCLASASSTVTCTSPASLSLLLSLSLQAQCPLSLNRLIDAYCLSYASGVGYKQRATKLGQAYKVAPYFFYHISHFLSPFLFFLSLSHSFKLNCSLPFLTLFICFFLPLFFAWNYSFSIFLFISSLAPLSLCVHYSFFIWNYTFPFFFSPTIFSCIFILSLSLPFL